MQYFDHEKLSVYQASIDFILLIELVIDKFPKGKSYLIDQLQRAGASIALNIAEGAGEYSGNEKVRFYRMAKRSATECGSIFDICHRLNLLEQSNYTRGRELLLRIVAMLVKLSKPK